MFDDSSRYDPLIDAIAEFRNAFDLLIDEEKARWSGYVAEAAPAEAPEPPSAEPRVEWQGRPEVHEALNEVKVKKRAKIQVHAPERAIAPPPVPLAAVAADHVETARSPGGGDPRQRLDVLAKHLDRRARQSRGTDLEADRRPAEVAER